MKILITGANGMLGRTLCRVLKKFEIIPTDRDSMDITKSDEVYRGIREHEPDVVIHCAAMSAVDLCETEKENAFLINAVGSSNVAVACHTIGARLIAISTDYVFDGSGEKSYSEYDVPNGGNTVYGQSKWAGEQLIRTHCPNHVIARVAWLYGPGGPSFVHTMIKLADGTRPALKVVDDQVGNPTSTDAVARALQEILKHPSIAGTFHLTCEGEVTWCEFAKKIFAIKGIKQTVLPCSTEEYPRPAPRPKNSRLEKLNLRLYGLKPMPSWDAELQTVLANPEFYRILD